MNKKLVLLTTLIVGFAYAAQPVQPCAPLCQCASGCINGNGSCQAENQLLRVDQINFGAPVRTVSWLDTSCADPYMNCVFALIGGQPVPAAPTSYDFQLYQLVGSDKLNLITNGSHGAYVLSSATCCIGGTIYIAVAGAANAAGNEIDIFTFDPALGTLSPTPVASFNHGGTVYSISWLCSCVGSTGSFLAIGGEASTIDKADVRVLRFTTTPTPALSLTGANKIHGATVYSVDWCTSKANCPLLAIGGRTSSLECGINIRIFSFDCSTAFLYPISQQAFGSELVNVVKWCCNNNCLINPILAVGGSKGSGTKGSKSNLRLYFLSSRTDKLIEYLKVIDNPQPNIYALDWNPSCSCSTITAGGGCLEEFGNACNPNLFVYTTKSHPKKISLVTEEQFDQNITSLAWYQQAGTIVHTFL